MPEGTTARQLVNFFFNPLSRNIPPPPVKIPGFPGLSKDVWHAMGIGSAALGLIAVSKAVRGPTREREKQERRERIKAMITATDITISPDPDLKDISGERRLRELGLAKAGSDKRAQAYRFLAPAVALVAAPALGKALPGRIEAKHRGEDLDRQIEEAENELDKLIYDELLRTRGLSGEVVQEIQSRIRKGSMQKEAVLGMLGRGLKKAGYGEGLLELLVQDSIPTEPCSREVLFLEAGFCVGLPRFPACWLVERCFGPPCPSCWPPRLASSITERPAPPM